MRFQYLVLILLWFSNPAWCEAVQVRSGDHPDFTRLVLKIPPGTQWSLERRGMRAELRIELENVTFETGNVFSRIPRNRLRDLRQPEPGAALEIEFGCSCTTRAFVQNSNLLVLDIVDGEPGSDLPVRSQGLKWGATTGAEPYRFKNRSGTGATEPKAIGQLVRSEPETPPNNAEEILQAVLVPAVANRTVDNTETWEQELVEELEKAATEGLLRRVPPVRKPVPDATRKEQAVAENRLDADADDPSESSFGMHLRLDPVEVTGLQPLVDSMSGTRSRNTCIETGRLALLDWSDGRPFSYQVSDLRSRLFGEFDRLDVVTAVKLSRVYLFFGFGAEAAAVAEMLPHDNSEKPLLESMAKIIDDGDLMTENPFDGMAGCDTDAAFWAFYSEAAGSSAELLNAKSVIRAFRRLPDHLKKYMAGKLIQKFVAAGSQDSAEKILNAVSLLPGDVPQSVKIVEAAIAAARGENEEVTDLLEGVIATGSEETPMALADLVEAEMRQRGTVSPEIPDLIAAYALELSESEFGFKLRRAQALALALTGRFNEAFQTNAAIVEQDGASKADLVTADLLPLLTERADDTTFLQLVLWQVADRETGLPEAVTSQISQRLLILGFPRVAETILGYSSKAPSLAETRVLRSRIALANGQADSALSELAGLDDIEAARVRARALWQVGDQVAAARTFQQADEPARADRAFWHAGLWDQVGDNSDRGYGEAATIALALRRSWERKREEPPLAGGRSLLAESQDARREVERMLILISDNTLPTPSRSEP